MKRLNEYCTLYFFIKYKAKRQNTKWLNEYCTLLLFYKTRGKKAKQREQERVLYFIYLKTSCRESPRFTVSRTGLGKTRFMIKFIISMTSIYINEREKTLDYVFGSCAKRTIEIIIFSWENPARSAALGFPVRFF